jgi:L-2,4-diaminobutyric acid acetyltransferase
MSRPSGERHPKICETTDSLQLTLRRPALADGPALHDLIGRCPPLDRNSRYCNLLQVTHFAETSVVAADSSGRLLGAVTGYLRPDASDTLFVWQVAVDAASRGRRLAPRMLEALLERPVCRDVHWLETSITPGNDASWAAFRAFARARGAGVEHRPWFLRDPHFAGQHDDEALLRIGPLRRSADQHSQETA